MIGAARSRIRIGLRLAALAIAAAVLIWVPFEDIDIRVVLLLSALLCAWLCFRLLANEKLEENERSVLGRHMFIGTLGGLLIIPVAILLLALKSGLHGHATSEFTLEQVGELLSLTPYLAAAGFLIGLGTGLWRGLVRGTI